MSPEQAVYDWKRDFTLPNDDERRGEIIKDITAIANSITQSPGFIVYGVDPRRPDPLVGITNTYDDAKLQQLLKDKVKPSVEFVYYEVSLGPKIIGVVQVTSTRQRPHIISIDIGKVRSGQIPIRRGSSTEGVTIEDLFEMFYGEKSGYFASVLEHKRLQIQDRQLKTELFESLLEQGKDIRRRAGNLLGLPLD